MFDTLCEEGRLLPVTPVPAFVDLVVIDEFLLRSLGPTSQGLIVLARKHAHGSRDGDVGGGCGMVRFHLFSGLFGETDPVVGIEVIAEPALDGIKAEAGAL